MSETQDWIDHRFLTIEEKFGVSNIADIIQNLCENPLTQDKTSSATLLGAPMLNAVILALLSEIVSADYTEERNELMVFSSGLPVTEIMKRPEKIRKNYLKRFLKRIIRYENNTDGISLVDFLLASRRKRLGISPRPIPEIVSPIQPVDHLRSQTGTQVGEIMPSSPPKETNISDAVDKWDAESETDTTDIDKGW